MTMMPARPPTTTTMTSWLLKLELGLGGTIDFGENDVSLKGVGVGSEELDGSDCSRD